MTLDEAIEFFGSEKELRKAINGSRQLVYGWRRKGYIPWVSQIEINKASNYKLKIDAVNPFKFNNQSEQQGAHG